MSGAPTRRVVLAVAALAVAGCHGRPGPHPSTTGTTGSSTPTSATPTSPSASSPTASTSSSIPSPTVSPTLSQARIRRRAGRCLLLGLGPNEDIDRAVELVGSLGLAGVFLVGRWTDPTLITRTAARVRRAATSAGHPGGVVAADQEGGLVQNLVADGFDALPSAERVARLGVAEATRLARLSATQMRAHGVNLFLGPVADVVSPALGASNAPIGALHRGYGTSAGTVSALVDAVIGGYRQGRVGTCVKHFPGLGAVRTNTDVGPATDRTTSSTSDTLIPFRRAFTAGASSVMVSSATYPRLDPDHPAVFSRSIVTGLLRDRLGFTGAVLSDDLGAAGAVASVTPSRRAADFVTAGGDLTLCADADLVATMVEGLRSRVGTDRLAEAIGRVDRLASTLGS
ncbi:glycoside hydrolase family 3 N-terminal domain-containing protein [Acidipropionibacterium timonense]|uniref:glycoside hydrolase family 3 N-terminal domain-containing protein n=1 Tax=Acidipropionibacterium timonense TaxID=2161818 RepID=UPI00103054E5|nr:glycoside hydrolase family 3 N-terminal domain-containing protein [Acidipropionibacterium timonense]